MRNRLPIKKIIKKYRKKLIIYDGNVNDHQVDALLNALLPDVPFAKSFANLAAQEFASIQNRVKGDLSTKHSLPMAALTTKIHCICCYLY